MPRSLLPENVEAYAVSLARETDVQARLRAETAKLPDAAMQIDADQGTLLSLLVKSIGARQVIEIGTFTGYSALSIAGALPEDGRLVCCDISEERTAIARRYWKEAGLDARIELRLAPALDTLADLLARDGAGSFDFAFIDADKTCNDAYYEGCLKLLRPNGLIAINNTLWGGAVVETKKGDADAEAFKALNLKIAHDARVEAVLLTVGDGVTLVRKR
ncbi:MAG: class I SAM-dependent methyltransferase [Parvibaculum sp.]